MIMSAKSDQHKRPRSTGVSLSIGKRDEQRDAVLAADAARDVPFAGHVLGEQDVSRPERNLPAALQLDLALTAQRDHVLPARRWMPVLKVVRRLTAELQSAHLDQLGQFAGTAARCELHIDLLGVR